MLKEISVLTGFVSGYDNYIAVSILEYKLKKEEIVLKLKAGQDNIHPDSPMYLERPEEDESTLVFDLALDMDILEKEELFPFLSLKVENTNTKTTFIGEPGLIVTKMEAEGSTVVIWAKPDYHSRFGDELLHRLESSQAWGIVKQG